MSRSQAFSIFRLRRRQLPARWLPVLMLVLIPVVYALAEPSQSTQASARTNALIERDRGLIANTERLKLNNVEMGILWSRLGSEYQDLMLCPEAENAYTRALDLLEHEPGAQDRYAITLDDLGSLYMWTRRLDAAERVSKRALAVAEGLGDPLAIARAESHLSDVYVTMGRNKKAAEYALKASRGLSAAPGGGGDDRASALLNYAYASCLEKHCSEGERAVHEAMDLIHAGTAPESIGYGKAYLVLGLIKQRTGAIAEAGEDMRESVRILDRDLPPSNPLLMDALEAYRTYLTENHRDDEAAQIAARERSAATPCRSCTIRVQGLR